MFETPPPYAWVIDTDTYAGNFERQLCAYVTGITGENARDMEKREAEQFAEQCGEGLFDEFEELVAQAILPPVFWSLVSTWSTPGTSAPQSVAIFMWQKPADKLKTILKERAHEFFQTGRTLTGEFRARVTGFRLLKLTLHEELVETY